MSQGKSAAQLKTALKYARIARDKEPSNQQVSGHFNEVKSKHDEVVSAEEETKGSAPSEETKKSSNAPMTMEEQMRSRVKINTEPEEEKKAPAQPAPQPQA